MHNPGKRLNLAAWGIVAMMAISLSGTGCTPSANHASVFRDADLNQDSHKAHALLIDAQQRAILTSPVSHPSANNGSLVMYCAEPSPDALVALSSAFAASASGSYANAQLQGAMQQSMSEAAAQLGRRSQSIQLLRDASYRLCEARMDGFITNGTFPVALNRLQDGMVTLLAIEQLTSPNENGAPVTITAPSIGGDLNVTQTTGKGAPSSAATTAKPTKTPTPTATPTTAAYKSNHAVDSALELANSGPDQNHGSVGNAPDPEFVKVAASAPTPTATPTPTRTPTPSRKRTPTPTPTSTPTPSSAGAEPAISPAVAQAVQRMVEIYQYKNLEEFCLTIGATELQANFQMAFEYRGTPGAEVMLKRLQEMERKEPIWDYCGNIFDKYKQDQTAQAPKTSPTPTAAPTAAMSRRHRTTPRARATAGGFVASYRS